MNEMGLDLDWLPYLALGTALLSLVLLIIIVVQGASIRKLRKRYNKWTNNTGVDGLEELLSKMHVDIEGLQLSKEQHQAMLEGIQRVQKTQVSNVGVIRYNAFEDRGGSDLSFSIALLNDQEDGVVFTGIHGRDESYVYAKPLVNGNSAYTLSPEEKKAMEAARQHIAKV